MMHQLQASDCNLTICNKLRWHFHRFRLSFAWNCTRQQNENWGPAFVPTECKMSQGLSEVMAGAICAVAKPHRIVHMTLKPPHPNRIGKTRKFRLSWRGKIDRAPTVLSGHFYRSNVHRQKAYKRLCSKPQSTSPRTSAAGDNEGPTDSNNRKSSFTKLGYFVPFSSIGFAPISLSLSTLLVSGDH